MYRAKGPFIKSNAVRIVDGFQLMNFDLCWSGSTGSLINKPCRTILMNYHFPDFLWPHCCESLINVTPTANKVCGAGVWSNDDTHYGKSCIGRSAFTLLLWTNMCLSFGNDHVLYMCDRATFRWREHREMICNMQSALPIVVRNCYSFCVVWDILLSRNVHYFFANSTRTCTQCCFVVVEDLVSIYFQSEMLGTELPGNSTVCGKFSGNSVPSICWNWSNWRQISFWSLKRRDRMKFNPKCCLWVRKLFP